MSLGLRHHIRRRKRAPSAQLPDKKFIRKEALDLLIYPVAIVAPLALMPQVYKLYATHNAEGLALTTWIVLGLINLVWILYGRVHRERPIVLTNVAFAFLNFSIALGVVLYG